MTDEERKDKLDALNKLKGEGFLSANDDPEGEVDTPDEHFKRVLDKRKKDEEDALNYK